MTWRTLDRTPRPDARWNFDRPREFPGYWLFVACVTALGLALLVWAL